MPSGVPRLAGTASRQLLTGIDHGMSTPNRAFADWSIRNVDDWRAARVLSRMVFSAVNGRRGERGQADLTICREMPKVASFETA